jgi:hypothetical protein
MGFKCLSRFAFNARNSAWLGLLIVGTSKPEIRIRAHRRRERAGMADTRSRTPQNALGRESRVLRVETPLLENESLQIRWESR